MTLLAEKTWKLHEAVSHACLSVVGITREAVEAHGDLKEAAIGGAS